MRRREIEESNHKVGSVRSHPVDRRQDFAHAKDVKVLEQLSPAAMAHWPIAARQLRDVGVLDEVDACSLATHCEAFTRWCSAGQQVARMLIEFGLRSGKQAQSLGSVASAATDSAKLAAEQRAAAWRRAPNSIMRRQDVEREIGLSRTTIYHRMKDGTFPAAVKLGARSVGWRVADIEAFLANPAAYRATAKSG
jgi:predicted DNA-binding transcriptional regulator AlpA/phage terminase small subunit